MRAFKRFLGGLFIVCILVFLICWGVGWVHVAATHDQSARQYVLSFTVNQEKAAGDIETAKQKVEHEIGTAHFGGKSAEGSLSAVNEADNHFTLTTTDNKQMEFTVPPGAAASTNLKNLRQGEHVKVEYKVENDKNVAQTVTATWNFSTTGQSERDDKARGDNNKPPS